MITKFFTMFCLTAALSLPAFAGTAHTNTSDPIKTLKSSKTVQKPINQFIKQYNQMEKLKVKKPHKAKSKPKQAKQNIEQTKANLHRKLHSKVYKSPFLLPAKVKKNKHLKHHRIPFYPDRYVPPEKPTLVSISRNSVNRIVCPDTIKDIVFSKEKGAIVKFEGNNAYIKLLEQKDPATGKIMYDKSPNEFYVTCNNTVYTIIAIPDNIGPRIIRLMGNDKKKILSNQRQFAQLPYEKKIIKIIKSVYKDNLPSTWDINSKTELYKKNNLLIKLVRTIKIVGTGFSVKEFSVSPDKNIKFMPLNERMFLIPALSKNIVAIALEKLSLKAGDRTRLFIVSKKGVNHYGY